PSPNDSSAPGTFTPRNTVLPARTSGQSMFPPNVPGTMVLRTSDAAGATPRQPRNGASGTSHLCRPSRDDERAVVRVESRSYRQDVSGRSAASSAVRAVLPSAPKPGPADDTP